MVLRRRAKRDRRVNPEFRKYRETIKKFRKQRVKTKRLMGRLLKIRKIEVI